MNDPAEVKGIESSAEPLMPPESLSSSDALSSASSSGSALRLKGRSPSSGGEPIDVVTLVVSVPGDMLLLPVARNASVPLQLGPTRSSGRGTWDPALTKTPKGAVCRASAGISDGGGDDVAPDGDVGLRSPGGSNGGKCLSKCSGTGCGFIRTCGYFARCL